MEKQLKPCILCIYYIQCVYDVMVTCCPVLLRFSLLSSRYKEEEEQSSYSALDHIRHFSDMRKLEESELSDGDGDGDGDVDEDDDSFGSPSLTEAVKQPLFRKSKSQVHIDCSYVYTPNNAHPYMDIFLHLSMVVECN